MAKASMTASRSELRKVQLSVSGPGSGQSRQGSADAPDPWTPESGIRPPINLDQLAGLTLLGGVRRSCIAAIVQNTVSLGIGFEVREGREDEVADPTQAERELRDQLDAMAQRDERSGSPDFKGLLARAKWDEQEVGNGYLEVSRNKLTGEVDGLYHLPGKRMRRRVVRERSPDGRTRHRIDGWVMGPRKGGEVADTVRFYDFGTKVQYDDEGKPTATLADSGRRWDVNEVIAFQLYTSASRDYGLPPDAQLANDYLGDKLAAQANVNYFDNDGVPPSVIFVQGKEVKGEGDEITIEVDPSFSRAIANTLSGAAPGSRVAIVGVPPGTKTEAHKLAVLSERDIGYVQYRADNRRRTLGAYRLAPVFVADIEDAGKDTAGVERALTKEQVFDGEQERWEGILGRGLVAEINPGLKPVFDELAIKGDEALRESANDLADRGAITRRDYRQAHGYGPLPEAEEGAAPELGQVEHGWNDELMTSRAPAQAMIATGDPTEREPIEKGQADLEREIAADMDDAIDAAIKRLNLAGGNGNVRPVVVEKGEDGKITITPQPVTA